MVFAWKNKQKKESVFPLFRVYLNNGKKYVNYLHSGESHLNAFASFFTCTFPDFTISNYQLGFRFKIFDILYIILTIYLVRWFYSQFLYRTSDD